MDNINYEIIDTFLNLGFKIVYIDSEYWIAESWIPSDGKAFFKHHLIGCLATNNIINKLRINSQDLAAEISNTKVRELYFSQETPWRYYVR